MVSSFEVDDTYDSAGAGQKKRKKKKTFFFFFFLMAVTISLSVHMLHCAIWIQ